MMNKKAFGIVAIATLFCIMLYAVAIVFIAQFYIQDHKGIQAQTVADLKEFRLHYILNGLLRSPLPDMQIQEVLSQSTIADYIVFYQEVLEETNTLEDTVTKILDVTISNMSVSEARKFWYATEEISRKEEQISRIIYRFEIQKGEETIFEKKWNGVCKRLSGEKIEQTPRQATAVLPSKEGNIFVLLEACGAETGGRRE